MLMSGIHEDANSLSYILSSTYKQCQNLSQALDESLETNKALHDENRSLRQELRDTRAELYSIATKGQYGDQLQQLFQKFAERQLEVDSLKEELKKYRSRREKNPNHLFSSVPYAGSDASEARANVTENHTVMERRNAETLLSTKRPVSNVQPKETANHSTRRKRKRPCLPGHKSFSTDSASASNPQQIWEMIRKHHDSERQAASVSIAAEDGEDYESGPQSRKKETNSSYDSSVRQRLDSLLSRPTPSRVKLSAGQCKSVEPLIQCKETPTTKSSAALNVMYTSEQRRLSGLGSSKISVMKAPSTFFTRGATAGGDDATPSRIALDKRPAANLTSISRLSRFDDSTEALSSNDILLRFMGPGSEGTIARLTPLARSNLLHEARTSMAFSAYEKEKDLTIRAQSPPGFWNVDMPGTQEADGD